MINDLADRERKKYELMWSKPDYRRWSPGRDIAKLALRKMRVERGATLFDFGCGDGKALDYFAEQGILCKGFDLVKLHPLAQAGCLWAIPEDFGTADYGFCADVLEHIPPEKVAPVLENIARHIRKELFFQIETVPDNMGRLIGKKLHLTVQPLAWWHSELRKQWNAVKVTPTNGTAINAHVLASV